jgi:hypothetical protein
LSTARPLMQLGVGELEALFARSRTDAHVLKQLERELQYRQVPRAVALLAEVQAAMYEAQPSSAVPAPPRPAPAVSPTPQQAGLWERPVAPAVTPVAAPTAATSAAETVKAPAGPKPPQPATSAMPVEDANKLLKATAGSTWESIEQTRRQLVQQSHPSRLRSMSPERSSQVLAEAKKVNAAYAALSQARCAGR